MRVCMNDLVVRTAIRALAASVAIALLAGCATPQRACAALPGCDFPLARASEFVPGKTTLAEVTALFGPAGGDEEVTIEQDMAGRTLPSPLNARVLVYRYVARDLTQATVPGSRPSRRAVLYFAEGKLVGYSTSSSFTSDTTVFAHQRAGELRKGASPETEVVRVIGKPGGRANYPLALEPDGRTLFYDHVVLDFPPGSNTASDMTVHLSAAGVLQDYAVSSKVSAAQGTRPAR